MGIRRLATAHPALTGFAAGVLAAAVVAGGGAAIAAIPSTSTGNITACVKSTTGATRIINYQAGRRCASGELTIHWHKGWRYRGGWSSSATYAPRDVAVYAGSAYVAKTAVGRNRVPNRYPANWGLVAARGAPGPRGVRGPGGHRGQAEFSPSGGSQRTWTAPAEVTAVLVELWGGGGGGGCGGGGTNGQVGENKRAGGGGGGGGSGGYLRAVVAVVPGRTYNLALGGVGAGCVVGGTAAGAGGASTFSGLGLASPYSAPGGAPGGNGQTYTASTPDGGLGGTPGFGGSGFQGPGSYIPRRGHDGREGMIGNGHPTSGVGSSCGQPGRGGTAIVGSMETPWARGGTGGTGTCAVSGTRDALPDGSAGYALLSW